MTNKSFSRALDWRSSLVSNERKTMLVMITFIVIYCFIGLLLDVYVHGVLQEEKTSSFYDILCSLLTLKLTPVFTIATLIVAVIAI